MKQTFIFNDNTNKIFEVVGQKNKKFDSMTIQISKIVDPNDMTITKDGAFIPFSYMYEEISNEDFVIYTSKYSYESVCKYYPWAKNI